MRPAWGQKFTKYFLVPQRYILGIMASLAILNAYTMRVSLSIAITEMVVHENFTVKRNNSDDCDLYDQHIRHFVEDRDILYDWDEYTQGVILSSFFWGYLISHVPGGVLSQQFGGKNVMGTGLLISAILTLIFPWLIQRSRGTIGIVIVARVVMGMGQGVLYPAINAILGQWVPARERAGIASVTYAGAHLGTVFTNVVSGFLISTTKDWASVFYLFGCLGLVWNFLWMLLCYSYPDLHPCMTDKEREFLLEELGERVDSDTKTIPWRDILTSMPVWSLIVGQWGHDWGWYVVSTDLPKYMHSVLRFNIAENGLWSSLPFLIMGFMTIAFGHSSDWLINRKFLTVTAARKTFSLIGHMGPAVFMISASYSGCNRTLVVALFTLSLAVMSFHYTGMKLNALDLSPNYSGTLMGLVNGFGVFAGMLAPYIIGILTPEQTLQEWRIIFWLTFVIFTVTMSAFLIFGSGEVQSWNAPKLEHIS
ncbi:sialin-like [Tenebrio molitor]|uniref:sialin-like n=1 Tax=Tenebrio molitor TaxID=7067 RepID=UPI00362475A7